METLDATLGALSEMLPEVPGRLGGLLEEAAGLERDAEALSEAVHRATQEAGDWRARVERGLSAVREAAEHHGEDLKVRQEQLDQDLDSLGDLQSGSDAVAAAARLAEEGLDRLRARLESGTSALDAAEAELAASFQALQQDLESGGENVRQGARAVAAGAEALGEELESAKAFLAERLTTLADAARTAGQMAEQALAGASGRLHSAGSELRAAQQSFQGDLVGDLEQLQGRWQERLAQELQARFSAGMEALRALMAATAQDATQAGLHWRGACSGTGPGFVAMEQELAPLASGVESVRSAAANVGLNA
jgi:chromosome segregation ATPase